MNASLLENHPAIAGIRTLPNESLNTKAWIRQARELASEYTGHRLIDLHGTLRSRILSFFWKGPVQRYPKFGMTRRLYDKTHMSRFRRILEATNVPQRYAMALGEKPPTPDKLVPEIYLTDDEQKDAHRTLTEKIANAPLVALHPYATHPAKQWPREHWNSLIQLLDASGINWVITGRDAVPLRGGDNRDYTNRTDLRQTCALLKEADILVTGDSGPMHLACGVGTPVAALFGPTAKAWGFYPSGPKDRVLEKNIPCRPCSLHGSRECPEGFDCLSGISPKEVFATVLQMTGHAV